MASKDLHITLVASTAIGDITKWKFKRVVGTNYCVLMTGGQWSNEILKSQDIGEQNSSLCAQTINVAASYVPFAYR